MADEAPHWRRNMYVCLFGSFTNVMAMTLLLPFLPIYVEHLGVTATRRSWNGRASPTASASWVPGWWRRCGARWPISMAAS